jgi:hypothetical protein
LAIPQQGGLALVGVGFSKWPRHRAPPSLAWERFAGTLSAPPLSRARRG